MFYFRPGPLKSQDRPCSRCVGELQGLQPMAKPARVKVANGAELQCDQELLNCPMDSPESSTVRITQGVTTGRV